MSALDRVKRACRLIEASDGRPRLETIASAAGLRPFHFHRLFKKTLGMTPGAYRAGAPGITIHYSVSHCALGGLLVAATSRGVCAIELSDAPGVFRERLRVRFPEAELVADDDALKTWVESVTRFIEAPPRENLKLPLDIRGTAFQRLVWNSLRRLRVGTAVSYAELAKRIGRPRAARAVAQACASNTLALRFLATEWSGETEP